MLRVNINGQVDFFAEGTTILEAARKVGFEIPTLCHDERLKPSGACRLCVVQIAGWNRLATACSTLIAEGMEIETESALVIRTRGAILDLLAREYPAHAVEADPEKPFHKLLVQYGITPSGAQNLNADSTHPYIRFDRSRCVKCFRCVRVCDEIQGQFVWQPWNRGSLTEIHTATGSTLLESQCVSCGACTDVCPTGALEDKTVSELGRPTKWTRSVCPYCGVGCELMLGTREGRLVKVKPAHDSQVNHGHLCVKGRYAFGFNSAPDRVTHPMVRQNGHWEKRTWFETIDIMAERLGDCVRRYGPDSVGILGSARGTNEENYLAQKFARLVLGTNNVDCCARVCHAPTATAMSEMLGTGAATNSYADIEEANGFLVCGANATENHPIVGNRIKQAVLRGASLVVIDPREIELARYADVHLAPRPGTNILLLNAIAAVIVEENLCDSAWIERRVEGFTEFRKFIKNYAPETVAFNCGVSARQIREAARVYAQSKPAMCFHGLGVTEHQQGVDGVRCLVNLALLTGNIGRPGSGVNPLRGQNNVQGAAHMGCEPRHLTGYADIEAARAGFETLWGVTMPKNRGMDLVEMINAAEAGQLKALWVIGYDIALTNADANRTAKALRNLEFLTVQDLFLNRTASEFASVFLPAASSFERDGTFMNSERRVQRIRQALPPPPYARADWQIICDVAKAMGKSEQFAFNGPQDVWDEIRSVWPAGRGITYERLERGGLQWPCPDESHAGTRILHEESFGGRSKAEFTRIQFYPSRENATPAFPFILTTGRTLAQFNAGTMTMRTRNSGLRPTDTLDMSPEDAGQLGLTDGDIVRVASHHGATTLPLRIDPRLRAGELFATFHTTSADLNRVTGSGVDERSHTPEYKVTAVDVQKVRAGDTDPGRFYEPNS